MKKMMVFVVMAMLLVACNSINAYNIKGEMGDGTWDGKKVNLMGYTMQAGMYPVDSTVIKDGVFSMKGKVDTTGWFILMLNSDQGQPIYKDFYLDGNVSFAMKNGKITVSGSTINNAYQAFGNQYDSMTAGLIRLNSEMKANPGNTEIEKAFNDEYDRFSKAFRELAMKTIQDNLTNPLGLHLFQSALSSLENSDIETILAKANPDFLADPTVKMVQKQLAQSKKVAIGSPYSDLTMSKPDGTTMSLSEYAGKGKYVLIDFWASWCGPCLRELPNVVACYEKYRSKGFEVVGVSLDKDAAAWKAAISKNKMTWPQMSDLAGWQSQAVVVYSFSGIPHTVLLDPKGVIVAKDLRGEDLDKKIAELLGN